MFCSPALTMHADSPARELTARLPPDPGGSPRYVSATTATLLSLPTPGPALGEADPSPARTEGSQVRGRRQHSDKEPPRQR